jgi:YGGT family protein
MTDYERTTVSHTEDVHTPAHSTVREYRTSGPTGLTMMQRLAALVFGIVQALIILRIVLLLLIANRDNEIVQAILATTNVLVEPFRGMFQIDRIAAQGSVLDVAAVVALIGWTLIEGLVLAILRIGSRGEATTV